MKTQHFLFLIIVFLFSVACRPSPADPVSTLITNVLLIDGTGRPAVRAAVRIREEQITAVGDLQPATGEMVLDGGGMVLAPGFIDTHSHHDEGMFDKRDMPEVVSQGITTIVVGQDGFSVFPLQELWAKLDSMPVAVNVASFAGHNTLRSLALKDFNRPADAAGIEKMQGLLRQELDAGAIGLSTGLEYDPGIFSNRNELISLAAILAPRGRRYISHLRSEDRYLWEALDEIITIGRTHGIPVQISHLKLAMVSHWGKADSLLNLLDATRAEGVQITADVYPYEYWQSTMTVLFPERNFEDLDAARFALTELTTPEKMIISAYALDTTLVGKTLAEISTARGEAPENTYLQLIRDAQVNHAEESIICSSMDPGDVTRLIAWPYSNICSDGSLNGQHPRGAGSFTRILRKYVREDKTISLEEAIRKMTSLAAENMGISRRGKIGPGYFADLVLFDPDTVTDRADLQNPGALSEGILRVWVNGKEVWNGSSTRQYPGKGLKME